MNNRSDILKSLLKEQLKVINDMVDNSEIMEIEFEIDDQDRVHIGFTPYTLKLSDYKVDYSEINKPKDFKNNKDFLNMIKPPTMEVTLDKDSLDD